MHHGVPEIEMNNDFNFSAKAHGNKQISRQISTIVFSNALVEMLLKKKLGDDTLYLRELQKKKERKKLLAPCLFSNAAGAPFAFTLSPQLRISTRETEGYRLTSFKCRSVCCAKC